MAGWATCSGCGLKHTRRPSGTCPRCGQNVEAPTEAVAEPLSPTVPDPEPPPLSLAASIEPEGLSRAARIAGILMIINGLLLFAERSGQGDAATDNLVGPGIGPAIGSMFVGALVAFGSTRAAVFAQVIIAIGLVFLSLALLGRGQPLAAGLQFCYSAGLTLLLFRRAPLWRTVVGVALVAFPFGMQSLGLYGIATGHFPIARLIAGRDLVDLAAGPVHGAGFQYTIDNPGKYWFMRSEAALRRDKAAADMWVTRPDLDAHILVVPEAIGANMTVDMDRYQAAVIKNYAAYAFVVKDQKPFPATIGEARILRGKGRIITGELDFVIALYVQPPYAAQVVGFGPAASFGDVSADVVRVATSLRF